MSMRALLLATRDHLRTNLGVDQHMCAVRPGPEPPPSCGELYLSIYGTGWSPSGNDHKAERGIGELYRIGVSITRRCTYAPNDRWDDEPFLDDFYALESTARLVIKNVHQNLTLFQAANDLVSGADKFLTPLFWLGGDASPREVGADWFTSIAESTDFGPSAAVAGLVLELTFGEATRLQTVANME